MKNTYLLLLLFSLLFNTSIYCYTERNLLQQKADIGKLKEVLILNQKWVPYPEYKDREGWNQLLGKNREDLIKQGELYLEYPWMVVKASDYLEYGRSGSRIIMEEPFGKNSKALATLIIAELAEGKGRFLDQIINGTTLFCEMTTWVLSAHLQAFQSTKGSFPNYKEDVIDLTAGDLGSLLSWDYYFFHKEMDAVNPIISDRLRNELQKRILDPYIKPNTWWWVASDYIPGRMVNNWNPWCNFNVLQCYMLLENNPDKLSAAVHKTMVSVDKFINYTKNDGACEEGPSYWGHAAGKMYDYLKMLADATGNQIAIFNEPLIKNMGEYISRSYIGNGWVVNFADASAKGGGEGALIYRYGKAVNSSEMMSYAKYLDEKKQKESIEMNRDFFRLLQTIYYHNEMENYQGKYKTPATTWYADTKFCYMKDPSGLFFACNAGHNAESHNHNDVGSFILYLNSNPLFIDAGVGTYTRQTFSNERYSIWTMQSDYHNLPKINGVSQKDGAEYKATKVDFNEKKRSFTADIASAYPKEAGINYWNRSYTLQNKTLVISDNFSLNKTDKNNEIIFLTALKGDISNPGEVRFTQNGKVVKLIYDKNSFQPEIQPVKLDDKRLSSVWGPEIYRIKLIANTKTLKGKYNFIVKVSK